MQQSWLLRWLAVVDVDGAVVAQQRADRREGDADVDVTLMAANAILARVDARGAQARQRNAQRAGDQRCAELTEDDASARVLAPEPELEVAETLDELVRAARVLPRVEVAAVERAPPALAVRRGRHDETGLDRGACARQAHEPRQDAGQPAGPVRHAKHAVRAQHRSRA